MAWTVRSSSPDLQDSIKATDPAKPSVERIQIVAFGYITKALQYGQSMAA